MNESCKLFRIFLIKFTDRLFQLHNEKREWNNIESVSIHSSADKRVESIGSSTEVTTTNSEPNVMTRVPVIGPQPEQMRSHGSFFKFFK